MHAFMQASHAAMHALHMSSSCMAHSSMQAWQVAMHASSAAIIAGMFMPMGRIIMRIMVEHMSAQFMHIDLAPAMSSPMAWSAHIVHAISQAEQASIQACIFIMSMPSTGIDMLIIMSLIALIATADRRGTESLT